MQETREDTAQASGMPELPLELVAELLTRNKFYVASLSLSVEVGAYLQ